MKRYLLSFGVIILFTFYALGQRLLEVLNTPLSVSEGGATPPLPSQNGANDAPPASVSSSSGQYKDGSYTGSAVDAYYGMVQVRATVKNGRLASVQLLDYPHDRSTSREINTQAMPSLISDAVKIQSAQVDMVSGATESSGAFRRSLDSALAQARN